MKTMRKVTPDDFDRVKSDSCGNPRYAIHFLALDVIGPDAGLDLSARYVAACKLANKLGGRKFHNRSYGGGIVFQSYSLEHTCAAINKLIGAV